MCGILGVINGEKSWAQLSGINKYMQQGCVTGLFRGDDSTGLLQITKGNDARVFRATVDGYYFAQHKKVQEILRNVDSNPLTVIHHRAATHGSVSHANCHPFEHEMPDGKYVVGVHNGTIHSYSAREDGLSFDVDSDWLYYRIAKMGAPAALGALTSGAYALVWFEKPSNKVFLAANKDRPLHWAAVKGKNILLIASESEMLYWLAHRNGMEVEQVYYPSHDKVWEFDPAGDLRAAVAHDLIKPPKSKSSEYNYPRTPVVAGASNELKRETDRAIVTDKWGPEHVTSCGFEYMEELSFSMKRAVPIETNRADARAVFGEVISDKTTQVMDAVIPNTNQAVVDNMEKSYDICVKAIGVRTVVEKTTGNTNSLLLVSVPTRTMSTNEEVVELDDLPFGTTGSSVPTVKGPNGREISCVDYMNLIKYGCGLCSGDLSLRDADEIEWVNNQSPVCKACVEDWRRMSA